MKKKGIIILLLLTLSFTNKDESKDFLYEVKVFPAFENLAEIEIIKVGNTGKIKLKIFKDYKSGQKTEYNSNLNHTDFKYFFQTLNGISMSEMTSDNIIVEDGITFRNKFTQNGHSTEFEFWSPGKNSKYYKITDAVIGLLKRKFRGDFEKKYLASLEKYYKE
jgi:hypothetical protein